MIGAHGSPYLQKDQWQVGFGYRWMESHRHFVGTTEQANREEEGTEVINKVHLLDFSVAYAPSLRWNMTLSIPYLIAERSQPNRAQGNRNHTAARGIGDVTFVPRLWVWDPAEHSDGNLSLGAGGKLPTGEPNVTDTFINAQGDPEIRTVDQSIQPGDGGWGIVVDAQFFKRIGSFVPYISGTYLINPRDTNHVKTYRTQAGEEVMSVPDQYMARTGVSYGFTFLDGLAVSLGVRIEGVPVRDIWGESDGFRRPGYAFSIEPGIAYAFGRHAIGISAPVALVRERQVSVPDERNNRHGDAAFADYLILASYSFRFGGESPPAEAGAEANNGAAGAAQE